MDATLRHPVLFHVISSSFHSSPSLLISSHPPLFRFILSHPISFHPFSFVSACPISSLPISSLFIPSHLIPFQFQRELIKEEREETEEAKQVRLTYLAAQESSTKLLSEPPAIAQIGAYVFYSVRQSVLASFSMRGNSCVCVCVQVCVRLVGFMSVRIPVYLCMCMCMCVVYCQLSLCRRKLDDPHCSLCFIPFILSLYLLLDKPNNSNEQMKSTQSLPRQLPA